MLARKTNNLPKLMGILNITPDSFSDGGLYFQKPGKALEKIKSLSSDGAEIIDIGAESTRPDAQEISHVQEIERLLPVFEKLVGKVPCQGDLGVAPQISLDTRNAKTADFFLREYSKNIDFINDVSSLEDSDMAEILVQHSGWQGELILTHHRGIPASKKDPERKTNPQIIDEIIEFFQLRLKKLETLGFQKTRVILDPGLGFGKNTTENLLIIQKINQLKEAFDLKILVGHSRKRFVTDFFFLDSDPDLKSKDLASHNLALVLASKNIDIIRSHEIKILKSLLNLSF